MASAGVAAAKTLRKTSRGFPPRPSWLLILPARTMSRLYAATSTGSRRSLQGWMPRMAIALWRPPRFAGGGVGVLLTAIGIVPEWMLDDKAPPPRHRVCSNTPKPSRPDHLNPAMYEEF